MRVIVFGAGAYFKKRKDDLKEGAEIIAIADNDNTLWDTYIDGVEIIPPSKIHNFVYDRIILMSLKYFEMKQQLSELGITQKIYSYDEHMGDLERGKLQMIFSIHDDSKEKRKALIISSSLGYHGGSIVASYAAFLMRDMGYSTYIAAPDGNAIFIDEMVEQGVNILLYKNLPFAREKELFWVRDFEQIIVNTLPMIGCANEISKMKRIHLWLHESASHYVYIEKQFPDLIETVFYDLEIHAVSVPARNNFQRYFPNEKIDILPYGIPDTSRMITVNNKNKIVVLAIIGYYAEIKGQDILLDAVRGMTQEEKTQIEVWMIGAYNMNSKYFKEVKSKIDKKMAVKMIGELNREEMEDIYPQIDVVVNPSRQDSLPTVVAEGMMYSKICITSEVTGMAQYIDNGKNGFVCKVDDANDLREKIRWIIYHREEAEKIGEKARMTYEQNFTMEKFKERLEHILGLKEG